MFAIVLSVFWHVHWQRSFYSWEAEKNLWYSVSVLCFVSIQTFWWILL